MSVYKDWLDVIRTVLILLEAIIVLVWMDMNWNQIIILVQVRTTTGAVYILLTSWFTQYNNCLANKKTCIRYEISPLNLKTTWYMKKYIYVCVCFM